MSTDENISEQLSAYLDGELSDSQARRVEAALRDDPALARELEALKATRQRLRAMPAAKAPEGFAATVLERAERERLVAPTPAPGRWSRWTSLATAAVVLLVVGVGVVITISVTMIPSWSDKLTRGRGGPDQVAVAPAAENKLEVGDEKGAKGLSRGTAVTSAEEAASSRLGLAETKAPTGDEVKSLRQLDVVAGSADVSAGYATSTDRPSERFGATNVALRYESRDKLAAAKSESSTTLPVVDQMGEMPAIAAMPGPREDRRRGVVTQVGEPLCRPPVEDEELRLAGRGGTLALEAVAPTEAPPASVRPLPPTEPPDHQRASVTEEEFGLWGAWRHWLELPSDKPAAQPTSQPTTAPTSQPATAPATQPAAETP